MKPTETLDHVEAFTNDRSAPAKARAEVADWLGRYRHATDLVAALKADRGQAQQRVAEARESAPAYLIAALAAGPVEPGSIATDLGTLAYEVDAIGERLMIAERARSTCHDMATRRAFHPHRAELLRWVAERRVEVTWWEPVPQHVGLAWSAIGSVFRVLLPYEAIAPEADDSALTPSPRRSLDLDLGAWSARERLAVDRAWFAWSAIAAGDYRTVAEDRGLLALLLTMPWRDRPALEARPGHAPATRRGLLSASR